MSIEDPVLFVDGRDGGINCVEVLDLGEGLTLNLDIPGGSDPDAALVYASIIGRLGVPVGARALAALSPDEMREAMMWATTELLHQQLDAGKLERRPMPTCVARTMRPGPR
jgi:hypothetical protein